MQEIFQILRIGMTVIVLPIIVSIILSMLCWALMYGGCTGYYSAKFNHLERLRAFLRLAPKPEDKKEGK